MPKAPANSTHRSFTQRSAALCKQPSNATRREGRRREKLRRAHCTMDPPENPIPSAPAVPPMQEVLNSWFMLGRLGGYNSSNLQAGAATLFRRFMKGFMLGRLGGYNSSQPAGGCCNSFQEVHEKVHAGPADRVQLSQPAGGCCSTTMNRPSASTTMNRPRNKALGLFIVL